MLNRWLVVCAIVFASAPLSFGCSCGVPAKAIKNPAAWKRQEVKRGFKDAGVVFRGTLTAIDYKEPERTVRLIPSAPPRPVPRRFVATFQIHEQWKGEPAEFIEIYTREPGGDCIGFSGTLNQEYVIFAFPQVIQPSKPNVWVLLEWNDLLPIGTHILRMEEGCGMLSGNTGAQEVRDILPKAKKR